MSEILEQISTAVIEGELDEIVDLTEDALDEDLSAEEILNNGLMAGMDYVGVEFKAGNMFVPEVLRSAKTMQNAMDILNPLLAESGAPMVGKILIGTVKGDLHDIGKGLVASMLEGGGFEVIDLGVDVPAEKFVAQAKEANAGIIALSALLTTTMPSMKTVVDAVREAGLDSQCKVIIGGAPITQEYADSIGADGFSPSASGAVELVRKLLAA